MIPFSLCDRCGHLGRWLKCPDCGRQAETRTVLPDRPSLAISRLCGTVNEAIKRRPIGYALVVVYQDKIEGSSFYIPTGQEGTLYYAIHSLAARLRE